VSLADVFASNALVRWLRGDPGRYDLLTRMIDARLGDRLLTAGAGDPGLVAALAKVTGLSGKAIARAATPQEAHTLQEAAERAGVLVEVVDVVSAPVAELLPEIRRVLRQGGRVVLVVRRKAADAPAPASVQATCATHFKGARVLFDRDGVAIVEALKGQST
jgi:hypothetical protein